MGIARVDIRSGIARYNDTDTADVGRRLDQSDNELRKHSVARTTEAQVDGSCDLAAQLVRLSCLVALPSLLCPLAFLLSRIDPVIGSELVT